MRMAAEWPDATKFKTNPTLYAFHTNTDNPHVHVLVTARDSSGKKLDLSDRQYHTRALTKRGRRSTSGKSSMVSRRHTVKNTGRKDSGKSNT